MNDYSASYHNYIGFTIRLFRINETYKNPRRTDWDLYHEVLRDKLESSGLNKGLGVEDMAIFPSRSHNKLKP